ncbi:uncharacterized protein LOC129921125 [Episyrphus balteatus]|uniref:uncharacterized protein LOC129921125 n=1 Tax=Episyrphus balteatus TaxID=286459 RepID=UPI002484E5C7|nr:uncharacterized protein LOC129921125 [Episyrphus balteatus]
MGLKVSGCCCMNLRGAGYAHGWLGLLILTLLIGSTIKRIYLFDPEKVQLFKNDDFRPEVTRSLNGEIISLAMLLFDALVSILLIGGLLQNKHIMLLPWLILRGIGLIITIPLVLLLLLFASLSSDSDEIVAALFAVFITCLFVWSWIVIYSLFQEIRSIKEKTLLPIMPVQRIESGPISQQPPPYQMYNK